MTEQGRLHDARRLLVDLISETDSGEDTQRLSALDAQLAQYHYDKAQQWLLKGFPLQAYADLGECLRFDPVHVRARFQSEDLWQRYQQDRQWRQQYFDAIDQEQWERALDLLRDPEDPYFVRVHWGRTLELVAKCWQSLAGEFDRATRLGPQRMAQVLERAEAFEQRHYDWVVAWQHDTVSDLRFWRDQIEVYMTAETLLQEARRQFRDGASAAAIRSLGRVVLMHPHGERLRDEFLERRQQRGDELLRSIHDAVEAGEWKEFLRLEAMLRAYGGEAQAQVDEDKLLAARERGVAHLLQEATDYEDRGLAGNALLALAEARQLQPGLSGVALRWQRLRRAVVEVPLVEVTAQLSGEWQDTIGGVRVVRGEAVYEEERGRRMQRTELSSAPAGEQWVDNPTYEAQITLLQDAQRRTEQLHQRLQQAHPTEVRTLQRRFDCCATEVKRLQKRIRELAPREKRPRWIEDEVRVETRQLIARLEAPITIQRRGREPQQSRLRVSFSALDRLAEAHPEQSVPGDPNDLPSEAEARQRLSHELEEELRLLCAKLAREVARGLLERAQRAFEGGQREQGVELVVRALLEEELRSDPLDAVGEDAARLLGRWTDHIPATTRSLEPSGP